MNGIHFTNPEHDARPCRVTRMVGYLNLDNHFSADVSEDLGVMTWGDLKHRVLDEGGTWPSYDLFDVPQSDGKTVRYRAVDA
jgi:hypothetical protein